MAAKWIDDLNTSLAQVERAKPIIRQLMNGGEIKAVEGEENEICMMLDKTCGTDYFQCYDNGLVWGVGSRFQKIKSGYRPYNTFTIRKARDSGHVTEFEKRKYAMQKGGIYPYLTMHGYYDEKTGDIISLAIAKTKDIWDYIEKSNCDTKHTSQNQIGQAEFYTVSWNDFRRRGYRILEYNANNNGF